MKILYVEQDAELRDKAKEIAKQKGDYMIAVASLTEAMKALKTFKKHKLAFGMVIVGDHVVAQTWNQPQLLLAYLTKEYPRTPAVVYTKEDLEDFSIKLIGNPGADISTGLILQKPAHLGGIIDTVKIIAESSPHLRRPTKLPSRPKLAEVTAN